MRKGTGAGESYIIIELDARSDGTGSWGKDSIKKIKCNFFIIIIYGIILFVGT